jgi:hypothetical protein
MDSETGNIEWELRVSQLEQDTSKEQRSGRSLVKKRIIREVAFSLERTYIALSILLGQ